MYKSRKRKIYHSDKRYYFIPIIADYSDICYNHSDEIRRNLSDGQSSCEKMEYLRTKNPGLVFTGKNFWSHANRSWLAHSS